MATASHPPSEPLAVGAWGDDGEADSKSERYLARRLAAASADFKGVALTTFLLGAGVATMLWIASGILLEHWIVAGGLPHPEPVDLVDHLAAGTVEGVDVVPGHAEFVPSGDEFTVDRRDGSLSGLTDGGTFYRLSLGVVEARFQRGNALADCELLAAHLAAPAWEPNAGAPSTPGR
jgi:hypothetical protein